MESASSEFDVTKGGSEHLPYSANSLKFAASRSVEIAAMTESILHPSKTKLIFQCLPVHMRRRVMSHNAKRLPKRLRAGHLEQIRKGGKAPKQKRPSRKYRRRPGNLLEEYNRRQRSKVWLETHIWHAKRFHMIERWGHKIAYAPCDKAFRACYRASSAHCLIQDISYYVPIKITGPESHIKDMFSFVTDCNCGLGISAKAFTGGKREGSIHLYEKNCSPFSYIGKVSFLWNDNDKHKCLWLFVHPSFVKQVESTLTELLVTELIKQEDQESIPKKRKVCVNYSEYIKIELYPGRFNRFRLTGPKSHAVLVNSLKCLYNNIELNNNKWALTLNNDSLYLREKESYWNNLQYVSSPSQLPPKMVVGLIVKDPRLSRPHTRTKAVTENMYNVDRTALITIPEFIASSPLWDVELHDIIKNGNLNNTEYIKFLTKTHLVPGEVDTNNSVLQNVPIVLIQRPGSQDEDLKKLGYGSGWDILLPPGYGLHFWQTFQMFGARSGGLRETESVAFESGECYLPPDSKAGKEEETRIAREMRERYFRLPPSKRVNYIKLAIVSPFECPWEILLNDWNRDSTSEIFVLRDRQKLAILQECLIKKTELPNIENASSCLVAIYLKLVKKGSLNRNAIICLPQLDDSLHENDVFEPHHEDPNELLRKQKRKEHKIVLKQRMRHRSKLRKSGHKINPASKENIELSEYTQTMKELWIPTNITTVRNTCSRQIMGYLTQAAFSFTESRSCGIGYITYSALDALLKQKLDQVLVRNKSSRKYSLANICIIKNH